MTSSDPYRRIAPLYDRFIEPMQAGVRRTALDVLPPQAGWHVLDVGCGTGTGLVPYQIAGCTVTGVDVSPAMLEQAAARLGEKAELSLTDGGPLPFEDGRFDLTTSTLVLHEVPAGGRAAFLEEAARVTSGDGHVQIIDFRFGSLRGWKGRLLRGLTTLVERVSGHYDGYRTFRAAGGLPGLVNDSPLQLEREKIVAGGNLAIYILRPR